MIDIKAFFEQSEGKWFTQRTRYDLAQKKVENGNADLTVELLNSDDSAMLVEPWLRHIEALYEQGKSTLQGNASIEQGLLDLSAAKISWDAGEEKGANLILFLPDNDSQQQGQFLQNQINIDRAATVGNFIIGEDEALTLFTLSHGNNLIKERLWFAHPNLRLRTVWQENETGQQGWVMFYSEIRRINT